MCIVLAPRIYALVITDVLYLRNDIIFLYLLDCSDKKRGVHICIDRLTSNDQYLHAIVFLYLF
jgi:hypothetical protein